MNVFFHENLSLSGLEARVGFVDDVKTTAPAYNLAVGMSVLQRLYGRYNFHGET